MSWFSKKSSGEDLLPDLPSEEPGLPEIPYNELPELNTKGLPALPSIKVKEDINTDIKSAITPDETGMQKSIFKPISYPIHEEPLKELSPPMQEEKPRQKRSETIYVKLEKVESTSQTLAEIKDKIRDIEKLLQKTKDIKLEETKELEEWERQLQIIKTRMDMIDKELFE